MIITSKITMDLVRQGGIPAVEVMQDDRYSRNLELSLYADGTAWTIPEKASAVVRFMKPDGTGGAYDSLPDGTAACSFTENVLAVALAPQVCTAPGLVRLTVALSREEIQLNTFTVELRVNKNPGLETHSEDYVKIAGTLADSGWMPNMYLGTDEEGNVVAMDAVLPDVVTVAEDGYTDLTGLRQATNIAAVREGQTITVTTTVQGNVTHTDVITLNDDDYPVCVVSDGVECAVSWEGF